MINDPGTGSSLSLRGLFPRARITGAKDIAVSSLCSDASRCQPGDLFVALLDSDRDGHDDLAEAVNRGASAVVLERPLVSPVPSCLVSDTRDALGLICHHLAGQPADHLSLSGITGTSGKTATTHLLQSIWKKAGVRSGLVSTAHHDDGDNSLPTCRETPAPHELADLLGRMVDNRCQNAALEISSQALVRRHLAGLQLDAAVITRIRSAHLDYHGSLENYRKAKLRIFSLLKPGGTAIVNADDPATEALLATIDVPVLRFGIHAEADITATLLERSPGEQTFLLCSGNETASVQTSVIGDPHITHCLAAASLGLADGLDLATIAAGLSMASRIPGHMERIERGQPFQVYVDSANHPDTLAMALHAIRSTRPRRLICLFGPSSRQPAELRARMGRVVERSADIGMITSNDPGSEPPLSIIHDVLDGYDHPGHAHILPDRLEAICWSLDQARPGDAVLIAGKGFRRSQQTGYMLDTFDDHQIADEWLDQSHQHHLHRGHGPARLYTRHDVN